MMDFIKIIILAMTCLFTGILASGAGYAETCWDCGIATNNLGCWLRCLCYDSPGHWELTFVAIDLNQCLINANGVLQYQPNGNFEWSCDDYVWDQVSILNAACTDANGVKQSTWIDLNTVVSNTNGQLTC